MPAKVTRFSPVRASDTTIEPSEPGQGDGEDGGPVARGYAALVRRLALLGAGFRNGSTKSTRQAATSRISSGITGMRSGACI